MKKILLIVLSLFILYGCEEEVPRLSIPTQLQEDQGLITFDAVENADKYVIEINGIEYEITETSYMINEVGTYQVRVKAISEAFPDSFYTDKITFTITRELEAVHYNFSIHSTFDLLLLTLTTPMEIISVNDGISPLDETTYMMTDLSIFFNSEYLQTLNVGEHTFTFTLNYGSFDATINILDTTRPYMISQSQIYTSLDRDVTVMFDLFGGEVRSLSGNNITSEDYIIDGSSVTINQTYIQNAFTLDPSRETLIIGYTLERGLDMVVGYIFIYPNT